MGSLLLLIVLALFSRSVASDSPSVLSRIKRGAKCRRFNTVVEGEQEVVSAGGPGKCQALLKLNAKKDKLSYVIKCHDLSSKAVAADIRENSVNKYEANAVPLQLKGSKKRVAKNSIRAADIGKDNFERLIKQIFEGKAFVDVRTRKYPSGEARAQIIPPPNCLEPEHKTGNKICALPAETGPCKARFLHWYYDDEKEECAEFVYGGCQGNKNNFKTKSDCEDACGRIEKKEENEDTCLLPVKPGKCLAYFPRWHYDNEKGVCSNFIYGGCDGNKNNFATKDECEAKCLHI